ncbi:MAG: molecular chaperone DnaJ [Candidatus Hydrogenedentota bacterium]
MAKDFYDILGVTRAATQDEVRSAYRKLAHKYHPDKTGGDKPAEDKLKEINEAYDVLKNKEKRAQYDQFGQAGPGVPGGAGQGGFGGFGGGFSQGSPFEDIFESFFGGQPRGGAAKASRGADLEYRVKITLRDAAFGTKTRIRFTRKEVCGDCQGAGAAKGTTRETCQQCQGAGQVRMSQGFFSIARTCPVCQGAGQIVKDPCRKCHGSGAVNAEREINVDVPPGVDTGSRLCLQGEGEPGHGGGGRGDLYIFVEVQPDAVFKREGTNIVCEFPISFPQAILGATVRVPTLDGEADLKIPAGTQSGTAFKLRGLGVPDLRGYRRGDEFVEVHVETPAKITKEQRELIKRFEELSEEHSYPLHKRFMDKIRGSFGT